MYEQTGQCTRLHDIESSKRSQSQLVTAVDLCDGHETELLLCYNRKYKNTLSSDRQTKETIDFNLLFPRLRPGDFSDTCHFQKLQEDSKTNEFDFHWNTSPTSIVCCFPYIIAFTPDSIEIRLLVNGSLVHTATMPELQLISSKRDIYFATTAPEFIPKDFRIGCLENEQTPESTSSRRPSRINEFSNERILEIRHKIDKIEAHQQQQQSPSRTTVQPAAEIHINADDNFSKFLPIPRIADQSPCIQRARSLQKSKDKTIYDDTKRLISKSNSCGDSCAGKNHSEHDLTLINATKCLNEPAVPPNSPKINSTSPSPNSPTKIRLLKSPNNNKLIQFATANTDSGQSTEKLKPLRIFRIPLFNLTGTHSHYHIHNSTPKVSVKLPPRKIEEDGFETVFDCGSGGSGGGSGEGSSSGKCDNDECSTTNGISNNNESRNNGNSDDDDNDNDVDDDADDDDDDEDDQKQQKNCDIKRIRSNLQKLSTNCTNLSLFSSI